MRISYDVLRYIDLFSYNVEFIVIKNNEVVISFIIDLDKNKMLEFLKVNILVIKYILKKVFKDELESVLKEVLFKEDVEEKYIRDFLNCSVIDRNSESILIDKIMFIYKYGSKIVKKIVVDEKLKIM